MQIAGRANKQADFLVAWFFEFTFFSVAGKGDWDVLFFWQAYGDQDVFLLSNGFQLRDVAAADVAVAALLSARPEIA